MTKILKANNKILKSTNSWSSFSNTSVSRISAIGTVSTFNFIHQTGVFRIEWDMIIPPNYSYTSGRRILANANGVANNGFNLYQSSSAICANIFTGGAVAYLAFTNGTPIYDGIAHHYILIGTGTALYLYRDNTLIGSALISAGVLSVVNATNTLSVGHVTSTNPYCFAGYLRNILIYNTSDRSNLVFYLSLQDPLNIGKDIVGGLNGTVTNVSVVNQIETQNWAYFNGVNAWSTIGTTSTLGWMNDGIWSITFDIIVYRMVSGDRCFGTGTAATHKGFMIYTQGSHFYIYWLNGSGTYGSTPIIINSPILGMIYTIRISSDGVNIYVYTVDSLGNINRNTSTPCTFVSNTLSTYALQIGRIQSYYSDCKLRNLKIYSDTDGTLPFMDLPMQNTSDLMVDRVSGLVGTATNVQIINNNTNILTTL